MWTNSAPWPKAPDLDLPETWLLYVEDPPGMLCTLCTKYNEELQSDKLIWIKVHERLVCKRRINLTGNPHL